MTKEGPIEKRNDKASYLQRYFYTPSHSLQNTANEHISNLFFPLCLLEFILVHYNINEFEVVRNHNKTGKRLLWSRVQSAQERQRRSVCLEGSVNEEDG